MNYPACVKKLDYLFVQWLRCLFVCILCPSVFADFAQIKKQVYFDIPPQPLSEAIIDFGKQANLQILFASKDYKASISHPLIGRYSIEDALESLLLPFDLRFVIIKADLIVIQAIEKRSEKGKNVTAINSSELAFKKRVEEMVVERTRPPGSTNFQQVISTGLSKPKNIIDSSISASVVGSQPLKNAAPNSSAQAFQIIPGLNSQASSGSGFANVSIRGVPLPNNAGSRFVLVQEDGLPVLQFGDIDQVYQDVFVRIDQNVDRIEVIKQGSSAIFASNSPGGIINLVSKVGDEHELNFSISQGIGWDNRRIDFGWGEPVNEQWKFYLGGHYRSGRGEREVDYNANQGGQIKFNLTRKYNKGYIRLFLKYLDDRTITYLPMPQGVNGEDLGTLDARYDSQHTIFLRNNVGIDSQGNRYRSDIEDGISIEKRSAGLSLNFEISDIWNFENNFRYNQASGRTSGLVTAALGNAGELVDNFFSVENARLTYATGQLQNEIFERDALAQLIHYADIDQNDLGSYVNDMRFHGELGVFDISLGYYNAHQSIDTEWIWSSYFSEVSGNNANLINAEHYIYDPITNSNVYNTLTLDGLAAFGTPFWNNCCQRRYQQFLDIEALYFSVASTIEDISIEAGLRYDYGRSTGSFAGVSHFEEIDINLDGQINGPENNVPLVDAFQSQPINYTWGDFSYSLGGNWRVNKYNALFSRISKGIRIGADRKLFGGGILEDGSISEEDLIDRLYHAEIGYRHQKDSDALSLTALYSETHLADNNIVSALNTQVSPSFQSLGLEFEMFKRVGLLDVQAGISWLDAYRKNHADNEGENIIGQPAILWKLAPSISWKNMDIGAFIQGQTSTYGDRQNSFKIDGFIIANAYMNFYVNDAFIVSLNVNNLTNERAVTEVLSRSQFENQEVWSARSYPGRTASFSLSFSF